MDEPIKMRAFEGAVIGGRYRLETYLDEGAFGAVYRATHIAYGLELREVAIKIAKRPMTDQKAREAFADALLMTKVADTTPDASLREHFVAVHDAGRCPDNGPLAGHPYVVMELVPGGSLKSCLRVGPFPLKRAVAYFDQILKAMSFMHSETSDGRRRRAILHRDLKPSNILVTRRADRPDVLKVTDFGLAIEVDSILGWVESGGDLAYLAPESFSHNICSPQSDVYMLGLVFYEMLTEQNPFGEVGSTLRGTDEEKRKELCRLHLAARQLEQFPLLESHEELKQRPALGEVIRTALCTDMTARTYKNACELQAAWEEAKKPQGIARGVPASEKPWDTVKRLTGEAEQCFGAQDHERGEALLREALGINRDRKRVPEPMVVGRTYLRMVEYLIAQSRALQAINPAKAESLLTEARKVAHEGYELGGGQYKCRAICEAMAIYYEVRRLPQAAMFRNEANQYAMESSPQ